jgi:hypothetical protein
MTSREAAILDKVKAEPYYSVRFQPGTPLDLSLERTVELVNKSAVRLRGWDLPYYDAKTSVRDQRYVGSHIDWQRHVELWRMYRSGQFVYFGAPWDLAMDSQERLRQEFDRYVLAERSQKATISGLLSFVGMIYSVTEFYLFAARLAKALETRSVRLDVSLKNVENWALVSGEVGVPWFSFYASRTTRVDYTESDIERLVSDPVADAAINLREIFACFGWDNSADAIKSWQERFMAGRFAF